MGVCCGRVCASLWGVKLSDRFSEGSAEGPAGGAACAGSGGAGVGGGRQLEFSQDAELFRGAGVEELPAGLSELSHKQKKFVLEYLRLGNASAAARACGVHETNTTKILRRPNVLRFLHAVTAQVAASGDQLVKRQWELSVSLHEELQAIRAKPLAERTEAQRRREWHLIKAVNQTNTLLAALLNRLGVRLSGELTTTQNVNVTASGVAVLPELLNGYACARRVADPVSGRGGGGDAGSAGDADRGEEVAA